MLKPHNGDKPARPIDMFPVRVTVKSPTGENTYTKARVRTIGDKLEVWIEEQEFPHAVKLAFTASVDDIIQSTLGTDLAIRKQQATLITENSTAVQIQREAGCGCGSKLRGDIPNTLSRNAIMAAIANNWPELYPQQAAS